MLAGIETCAEEHQQARGIAEREQCAKSRQDQQEETPLYMHTLAGQSAMRARTASLHIADCHNGTGV